MSGTRSLDEPLAGKLLPVLLHRIRNTTQLVSGLNAVLALAPGAAPPVRRAEDLAEASREADELGWLLGVLAGGLGANLLMERRSPRGLALVLDLVREGLRREGKELVLEGELPLLTSEIPSEGELCWVAAELAWSAARLSFAEEARAWVLTAHGGRAQHAGLAERAHTSLPGCALSGGGGEWRLALPAPWLARA